MIHNLGTEMEIYSGADDRPCCLIRFPDGVSDEQIAAFEERYLTAHKIRPLPTPIDLSWVTTEPVYEGPRWLLWLLLAAKLALLGMVGAIAIAVILK